MPYITPDRYLEAAHKPTTVGELNYLLTLRAIGYVHTRGINYANINHVIGSYEQAMHSDERAPELSELAIQLRADCKKYWQNIDGARKTDVAGALRCSMLEFYRRVAVPYEDKKIAENWDVYPARWPVSIAPGNTNR